ncbi:MAG: VCBS repeat-containing protein [Chromatiaceae bacterium]|nr:VCBS repeat-containing protein [Chromatiaceae bacterium]MCF8003028.1 VCBS repeat-containing protein [Chromatiaceae bacterium]
MTDHDEKVRGDGFVPIKILLESFLIPRKIKKHHLFLPACLCIAIPFQTLASEETSYKNFKEIGLTPHRQNHQDARTYGDFSGLGNLELFEAEVTYWPPTTPEAAKPSIFRMKREGLAIQFTNGEGEVFEEVVEQDSYYPLSDPLLVTSEGCIHPRKAITMDFNQDSQPDVFVACTGWDNPPFPGETNKVVLSQPGGWYSVQDASQDVGYFHSVTSMDLNGDGYPDVMLTDNLDHDAVITLINNGDGTFTREYPKRLPTAIEGRSYFSIELVDVDQDGHEDLLLGGHEWENGSDTVILFNPGNNDFSTVSPMILPPVIGEGVVLDFTVTGTGADRAIWILRTSGGFESSFYGSRVVQKILFWPNFHSSLMLYENPGVWFPWLIPATIDGQDLMISDSAADQVFIPY